jgi:hypothetical protein
MTTYA